MKKIYVILLVFLFCQLWGQDFTGTWKSDTFEYNYNGADDILYTEVIYTESTFISTNYYSEKEGIQFKIWGIVEIIDIDSLILTTNKYMDQKTGEEISIENGQVRYINYIIKEDILTYEKRDKNQNEFGDFFLEFKKLK
ncbi:MAG: hypothetical protein OCD02_09195 [Spirochaetaceae bacterium]